MYRRRGGGGGPSPINDPSLYFPSQGPSGGFADPEASFRPVASVASFTQAPTGPQTIPGQFLKLSTQLLTGYEMGSAFDFDSLAAKGFTVSEVAERIINTPEGALQASAMENAVYDRWSSFGQGFGDMIIFWCPGCTQRMRQDWGITSGGDRYSYAMGSITGLVVSIMFPSPAKAPVTRAPKADYQRVLYEELREVNMVRGRTNCFNCVIAGHATLSGAPASALRGPVTSLTTAEAYFGQKFTQLLNKGAVIRTVEGWESGAIGAVAIGKGGETGHILLVQNFNGRAYFTDPQGLSVLPNLSGVKEWFLMKLP
ncbi:hypothetical protein HRD50_37880 [Corallococcus exiguus]|nr:hypothetical protein [Corallococcus exiguus]